MPAMPEAVVAASGVHIAKTAQLLCFPHPGAVGPGLIIIHGHARRDQELVEGSLLVVNEESEQFVLTFRLTSNLAQL